MDFDWEDTSYDDGSPCESEAQFLCFWLAVSDRLLYGRLKHGARQWGWSAGYSGEVASERGDAPTFEEAKSMAEGACKEMSRSKHVRMLREEDDYERATHPGY